MGRVAMPPGLFDATSNIGLRSNSAISRTVAGSNSTMSANARGGLRRDPPYRIRLSAKSARKRDAPLAFEDRCFN